MEVVHLDKNGIRLHQHMQVHHSLLYKGIVTSFATKAFWNNGGFGVVVRDWTSSFMAAVACSWSALLSVRCVFRYTQVQFQGHSQLVVAAIQRIQLFHRWHVNGVAHRWA
ncbi:hypothetical protein ACFX1T_032998 [Malus domestica]